ncbi:hypothetical protein [Gordonia sp. KTR9]|uniref:hypothetical protein n=1 Tax=Gordonia sp. KTR9 TaxID=337191 RepID=UPI0002F1F00C|nr:hypothetical protein [Gordonia sp. KTR9]
MMSAGVSFFDVVSGLTVDSGVVAGVVAAVVLSADIVVVTTAPLDALVSDCDASAHPTAPNAIAVMAATSFSDRIAVPKVFLPNSHVGL